MGRQYKQHQGYGQPRSQQPEGPEILPGTTRDLCLSLALRERIPVEIGPIPAASLGTANEILLCFASRGVLPVTRLDSAPVGTGRPGPVWQKLYAAFQAYRRQVAGTAPL